MPSARTLAVFPSDRICAKRRAALNFSARTSRRTRGPFVNVVLNNIDVTPRLFVHPMDGVFSLEFFPSIGPRGPGLHLRLWRGHRRQWLARPHRAGAAPGRFGQSELLPRAGGSQLQHPGWERTELVQIRELEFEETRAVSLRTPIGESREQRTRPH